jgi:hypothetical protein
MAVEQGLVFVSFFAKKKRSADSNCCENILVQFKALQATNPALRVWHHSLIPVGSNRDEALQAALENCAVALILVSAEYLASPHWQREGLPLLDAVKERGIRLRWQRISDCHCPPELTPYQPIFDDQSLVGSAQRKKREQQIAEHVFQAWSAPVAQHLQVIPVHQRGTAASPAVSQPAQRDAVAVVLTTSAEEKNGVRHYQWQVFSRKKGQNKHEADKEIFDALIESFKDLTWESLPRYFQALKRLMRLKGEFILEIFAPLDLLDADWGGICVDGGVDRKPLHTYQPYLLRSSDRLHPEMTERQESLSRMHAHLVSGTGAWLPQDDLAKAHILETLSGEILDDEAGKGVVAALWWRKSTTIINKSAWLKSAVWSMAPLVIWPSRKGPLRRGLKKEEVFSLVKELSLSREDTSQAAKVERPHCPDLDSLALRRQAKAKASKDWPHPKIDLGITILVDHPDRTPDREELQNLFSCFQEYSSQDLQGERSKSSPASHFSPLGEQPKSPPGSHLSPLADPLISP